MRRSADFAALAVIALGAGLAVAAGLGSPGRLSVSLERGERSLPATPFTPVCAVPFHLSSDPSGWAVSGSYDGVARLGPKGLSLEISGGRALAAHAPAQVQGVVFGVAGESEGGSWSVTHRAAPLGLGALEPGAARVVRPARLLVPGVGPAEIENGWLVVEHELAAPEVEGGRAWTYVHADRAALRGLLERGCPLAP